MRRIFASVAACAALALFAVGCQHVGGKCDCGYNPNDYHITGPTDPHASAPLMKGTGPSMPAPTPPGTGKKGGN
jgi:hypothetical protein